MAPGQYGGYRDFDYSCGEIGLDLLRRNEYFQEDRRHDCRQRNHGWDLRKDEMLRKRREMVFLDGSSESTWNLNGVNGKIQKLNWCSDRLLDREPSELSSGSNFALENGVQRSEDGDEASSGMKRKLSPIVWDLNNQKKSPKVRIEERARAVRKSCIGSVQYNQLQIDDEYQLMEEDYVLADAISLSRWADKNDALEDEKVKTSDCKSMPEEGKNVACSQDSQLHEKNLSSEHSEVILREGSQWVASREGSQGSASKPFDFGELFQENENDVLDVYGEVLNVEESDGSFETAAKVEDFGVKSLDHVEQSNRSINMLQGCRSVNEFDKLNKINEGAYGIVFRARDKKSGEIVALKKVKLEKEREGFPMTALREINIMSSLCHPSVVKVKEVVVGRDVDNIFMVMEYMEHDLKRLIETMKKPFHVSEIKCLMLQLLAGVKHLHDNWVLHRDLKTSNLLFNNCGELKICDFGLSRQYGSPLKPYTQLVVTLWYRAPELLLGAKEYSTAVDMWSVGCIMAELLAKEPLFPGKSELDQLDKIFRILGTPDEKVWPGFVALPGAKVNFIKKPCKLHEKFPRKSPTSFLGRPLLSNAGFDLLQKLLTFDPEKRITPEDAINHPWFHESPLPTSKEFMSTFPAQYKEARHHQRIINSPDLLERLRPKDSLNLDMCDLLDKKLRCFWGDKILFFSSVKTFVPRTICSH